MSPTKLKERIERLMPNGVPRYIRCWDSGPKGSADRYTVIYTGRLEGTRQWCNGAKAWTVYGVGMSANPFHPQGVGMHGEFVPGKHLGRRIKFQDLPPDCQKLVLHDYKILWSLNPTPTSSKATR